MLPGETPAVNKAGKTSRDPAAIALCLSGGGFRATFFHLGVVRLLAEIGWLSRVRHVYSVSGGSILAAHMALNWDAYLRPAPQEFRRICGELMAFGQFDVRGRIVRRAWIAGPTRTRLLEHYCERLYKGAKLQEIPETPAFNFTATSLTTGHLCAFRRGACVGVSVGAGGPHRHGPVFRKEARTFPLARAVAASAAFPAFFPPVKFRCRETPEPDDSERPYLPEWLHLSDGGIFDNLGVANLHHFANIGLFDKDDASFVQDGTTSFSVDFFTDGAAYAKGERLSHVVISDAGASFGYRVAPRFGLARRVLRTTDIMMARVAEMDLDRAGKKLGPLGIEEVLHVPIGEEVEGGRFKNGAEYRPQELGVQSQLRQVRTDFNRFDPYLLVALIRHGHEVAVDKLLLNRSTGWEREEWEEEPDLPPGLSLEWFRWKEGTEEGRHGRLVKRLVREGEVPILRGILSVRDPWGSLLMLGLFGFFAVVVVGLVALAKYLL